MCACAHARSGFPKEHACHPKLLRTSGDPRDEGLQRDETQARLVAEASEGDFVELATGDFGYVLSRCTQGGRRLQALMTEID